MLNNLLSLKKTRNFEKQVGVRLECQSSEKQRGLGRRSA